MAITFFGIGATPADSSGNSSSPAVITPPSSMQAGDLCVIYSTLRATSGSTSMSATGGQSWTALTQNNAASPYYNRSHIFWCRFNGSWGASPSVTMAASVNSVFMLVFRPNGGTSSTWLADVALANTSVAAPSSPFTFTRTGITTTHNNAVAIAAFYCPAQNTWGSLSGSGWDKTSLSAQYRNTTSGYQSTSFAYKIQASAGATGNVAQNESAGTAGTTHILSFYEVALPAVTAQATPIDTITDVSASGNGNVTDAGNGSVSVRGVCWDTSTNPTTANSHTDSGSGTGTFSAALTSLSPSTHYYARFYATNQAGTVYSANYEFDTVASPAPPTVALNSPADSSSDSDTTPTLTFTGTDVNGNTCRYQVQIDTVNTFDSQ